MASYDLAWCYAQAHRSVAAWCADKPVWQPWHEDLVQLVVWRAWVCAEEGRRVSRRSIRLFVVTAASRLFGEARYDGRRKLAVASEALGSHEPPPLPARRPEAVLALSRLRAHWGDLTELQQAALRCHLLGESWVEEGRRLGTTGENLHRSLEQALGRIDGRIKRTAARATSSRVRAAA